MARPIFTYGGPSPRIRAFASQEMLTRKNSAASLGVRRRSVDFDSRDGLGVNVGGLTALAVGAPAPDSEPPRAILKRRPGNIGPCGAEPERRRHRFVTSCDRQCRRPGWTRLDRPISPKSGPSPGMRALANQDSLTRRNVDGSRGVRRRSFSCKAAPVAAEGSAAAG